MTAVVVDPIGGIPIIGTVLPVTWTVLPIIGRVVPIVLRIIPVVWGVFPISCLCKTRARNCDSNE